MFWVIGKLTICFPEGIIVDSSNQKNDEKNFDTNITIDNIAPILYFKEALLIDKGSKGTILSNEPLRDNLPGWTFSSDKKSLYKNFANPIYYPITLTDFAENSSEVYVSIKKASNIMLYYASYDDNKTSNLETCGTIEGVENIINSSIYKSEALFARLEGNIDSNILGARAFMYTYWGENTSTLCSYSELTFNYGYNPSKTTWNDLSRTILIIL